MGHASSTSRPRLVQHKGQSLKLMLNSPELPLASQAEHRVGSRPAHTMRQYVVGPHAMLSPSAGTLQSAVHASEAVPADVTEHLATEYANAYRSQICACFGSAELMHSPTSNRYRLAELRSR